MPKEKNQKRKASPLQTNSQQRELYRQNNQAVLFHPGTDLADKIFRVAYRAGKKQSIY